MAQKETLQVLSRLTHDPHCGRSRPDQITHRLMRHIRHPYRRQFTGTV